MAIVRWEPFRDFDRAFRSIYGQGWDDSVLTRGSWMPPVDIYENGTEELVIAAELPEMKRENIQITLDRNTLTIAGERKFEGKDDQVHRLERNYGSFSRSFSLPESVDGTKVTADYKDGVLTIRLPKREESKPKQIKVNVAA